MLPILLTPIEDESMVSFLNRLAKRNHHDSIQQCFPTVELTYKNVTTNIFSDRQLRVIRKAIGGKEIALRKMTNNSFAGFSELLVKRSVKYCPHCIQKRPYMKAQWCYRLTCVCLEHQVYLLDHCARCRRRVTLSSLMEGRCVRCHFQLARARANPVLLDAIYQSQAEIYNWQAEEHPALGHLDRPQYEQLLVTSFGFLTGLKSSVPNSDKILRLEKRTLTDIEALAELIANAHLLYKEFPAHFEDTLNQFRTNKHTQTYPNKRAFEERLECPQYLVIKNAYENYWLRAFNQGEISQRNSVFKSNNELFESRQVVSGREVKAICRIGKRRLRTWVAQKQIHAPRVSQRRLFDRQEVLQLKRAIIQKKRYMTQKEVATHLGIYRTAVSKLVQGNLLPTTMLETGDRMFEKRAVEALIRRCYAKAHQGTGVTFYDAVSRYASQGMSIEKLIQLIQSGTVVVYTKGQKGTFRDLQIDEESLNQSIAILKAKENRDYSLQEVSACLGISQDALKALDGKEIFVSKRKTKQADGRVWYFYDRQMVDEWKSQLLTTREAAQVLGLCEQSITRLIRAGKLTDVYQGLTRSCFLNRNDVMNLKQRRSV